MRGWLVASAFVHDDEYLELLAGFEAAAGQLGVGLERRTNVEVAPMLGTPGGLVEAPDFALLWCKDIQLARHLEACGVRLFNRAEAIEISNAIAPEHLELCLDNPFDYLDKVRHAGSIFLGRNCPEALGDYLAGPNHTLPTGGTARFYSPLSVDDFVKKSQYSYFTADALRAVAGKIARFARKEGLEGHARSALSRFEET